MGGCLPHSGGAGIPNGATLVDSGDTQTAVSAINGAAGSVGTAVAGAYGSATINANGAHTYTLNNASAAVQTLAAGQTVTDSFTYTMRDTAGATSSTTLDVTVTGKNDTPVAVANTAAAQEDTTTSATGNVLTNDTDVDSGDTKTVSAVKGVAGNVGLSVAGTYGSVTINADGSYTYTLNNASAAVQALRAGQTVTDGFAYTMRDTAGATSSTTLAVSVAGTNDGPSALSVSNTSVIENATTGHVVAYATPVDADFNDTLTYSLVGASGPFAIGSANGIITVNGTLDYEATPSYNLTVRVTDSGGLYADHATTITVVDAIEGSNNADTLTGTSGDDVMFGLNGNDSLTGGNGDDLVVGGAGSDNMDGGSGLDTLSYFTSNAGVTVDLSTGAASGGHAAGDTLTNFENLTGSNFGDILTGDGSDNIIIGLNGNDVISGGAGNDRNQASHRRLDRGRADVVQSRVRLRLSQAFPVSISTTCWRNGSFRRLRRLPSGLASSSEMAPVSGAACSPPMTLGASWFGRCLGLTCSQRRT